MKHLSELLPDTVNSYYTVNSRNKNTITVDSSNSLTVEEKIKQILDEESITPEGVAHLLAEGLDDIKSLKYYLILTSEHNTTRLLEAMHLTQDAAREGKIRTNKAIYFQAILRKWGFKTKFKI